MNGIYLEIQLETLNLFLGAASGQKFLTEFIEVGGVLTLLEIIGLTKISETDKEQSLKILYKITSIGRKYKELVCESYGVRAVCECLTKSESLRCQEACRTVLLSLANGNPRYLDLIYKAMTMLLKSNSPKAQRIAAQILQEIQPSVKSVSLNVVHPVLSLLRSLYIEVQYEGCLLIKQLVQYKSICQELLTALVALLRPSDMELNEISDILEDHNVSTNNYNSSVPVFIQQAIAAKLIGVLSKDNLDIAKSFLKLDCVSSLLYAMSNKKYADSQKQAGLTLQFFIHSFHEVESGVREAIGQAFFFDYMNNASDFHLKLTSIQLDILKGSKVSLTGDCIN